MDKRQQKQMNFSIIWFLATIAIVWALQGVFRSVATPQMEVPYSQFRTDLSEGLISEVTIEGDQLYYSCEGESCGELDEVIESTWVQRLLEANPDVEMPNVLYHTVLVEDPDLIDELLASGVEFGAELDEPSIWVTVLGWIVPLLPLVLIWFLMFRRMGQQGSPVMQIGKSNAKEIPGAMTGVKFADVGGADEVEVELKEIIEFLKNPEKFTRLGAKLPKGPVGPPSSSVASFVAI